MVAINILDSLIKAQRSDLVRYASRLDAKDGYINKQNSFLTELTAARNSIPTQKYPDMWVKVEWEMAHLTKIDPEIGGLGINWRVRPSGILAPLYFDLF